MAIPQIKMRIFYLGLPLALLLNGCQGKADKKGVETQLKVPRENTLSDRETREGWELLFDGKTFDGWRNIGQKEVQTALWKIENGEIHKVNSGDVPLLADGQPVDGGDLMTVEAFDD